MTSASSSTTIAKVGPPSREKVTLFVGKYGALIVLALLIGVFWALSPEYFLTTNNMLQILNQSSLVAIAASGLTLVLAVNRFDLSIGATASLAGITLAWLLMHGQSIVVAVVAGLGMGLMIGVLNAVLVTRIGVNALVATLGVGSVAVGVNYFISKGAAQPFGVRVPEFVSVSVGTWFGVPKNVYYMVVVVAIIWFLLERTDLGRNMKAVGGNDEAARLSGVNVKGVTSIAFIIGALLSAITGILLVAVVGSGQPTGGDGYTMQAFAAAFLGTAVLRKGEFHILGTLVGVITVAVGFNGLALAGVESFWQFLFQGVILLAAVSFSSVAQQMTRKS
ncbi:MAG: ABC transporter permease [Actinobacteria bacterium HGW-Actinobacteria-8]|nr:MAG: ABC transporter permease [Actinobacteria bacterium HGW-Actinobacteria-8]